MRIPTFVRGVIVSAEQNQQKVGTWRQTTTRKGSTEATKQQQNFWQCCLCSRRSSRSRVTPAPTRASAFGTTSSLEDLAASTERTDENHEWLARLPANEKQLLAVRAQRGRRRPEWAGTKLNGMGSCKESTGV